MKPLIVFVLWAAHAFDAVFTLKWMANIGIAEAELNPLLANAWAVHPGTFLFTKFTLLTLASIAAFHSWDDVRMRAVIVGLTLVSVGLVGYEIRHWDLI